MQVVFIIYIAAAVIASSDDTEAMSLWQIQQIWLFNDVQLMMSFFFFLG